MVRPQGPGGTCVLVTTLDDWNDDNENTHVPNNRGNSGNRNERNVMTGDGKGVSRHFAGRWRDIRGAFLWFCLFLSFRMTGLLSRRESMFPPFGR
jgi:hypothetical protein